MKTYESMPANKRSSTVKKARTIDYLVPENSDKSDDLVEIVGAIQSLIEIILDKFNKRTAEVNKEIELEIEEGISKCKTKIQNSIQKTMKDLSGKTEAFNGKVAQVESEVKELIFHLEKDKEKLVHSTNSAIKQIEHLHSNLMKNANRLIEEFQNISKIDRKIPLQVDDEVEKLKKKLSTFGKGRDMDSVKYIKLILENL